MVDILVHFMLFMLGVLCWFNCSAVHFLLLNFSFFIDHVYVLRICSGFFFISSHTSGTMYISCNAGVNYFIRLYLANDKGTIKVKAIPPIFFHHTVYHIIQYKICTQFCCARSALL